MIIRSCKLILVVVIATFCSCIKMYETPTHESVLIWTDSEMMSSDGYRLFVSDEDLGALIKWEGGHGCDSVGYLIFDLPIGERLTFKLQSPTGETTDLVTVELYPGGSGAHIKRHNNSTVNMDGNTYDGCTLLQLGW